MTPEQLATELDQISLEKLVDLVLDTTDPQEQVQFYGWVLSNKSHVQHKQALALAQAGRCHPETARLWLSGANKCTCGARLYGKARARFDSEVSMALAFGEFINRDLIAELQL